MSTEAKVLKFERREDTEVEESKKETDHEADYRKRRDRMAADRRRSNLSVTRSYRLLRRSGRDPGTGGK